ncbi:MAG: thiamine phosphate synthase, partial [Chloroflexi bacterium]|nr:thiamine phosphate synthase [Chloroflexota bacterium]
MLRVVDANLDRLREGLRVLADVARFVLDDAELSRQLKSLRHQAAAQFRSLEPQLLAARRAAEDGGPSLTPGISAKHRDLGDLVRANAGRAEESLRVLEECARLAGSKPRTASPAKLESIRFQVYEIEKKLVSRVMRQEKLARLAGLYLVLDTQSLRGRDAVEVALQAIRGGATTVQLRDKHSSRAAML